MRLNLTERQRKLYEEHAALVPLAASRYTRAYPWAPREELFQAARIGLCKAARRWDSARRVPFPAYARKLVNWQCAQSIAGAWRGAKAAEDARLPEISADEVCGPDTFTVGELAEDLGGQEDLQQGFRDEQLDGLLYAMREAVASGAGLTELERRAVELRLADLSRKNIADKLGFSEAHVKRITRGAVGKLRVHFASRGALPPSASLPPDGNHAGNFR